MAKKSDLMGLGSPPALAGLAATDPFIYTGATLNNANGITFASAQIIGGQQYLSVFATVTSGAFFQLPTVGGFQGCLLGDDFIFNNNTAVTVVICAPSGATMSVSGTNFAGTTGFSLSSHFSVTMYPLTATSWMGLHGT
jgi:hypothetical protein